MKKLLIIGLISISSLMANGMENGTNVYLNKQEIDVIQNIQDITKATDKLIGMATSNRERTIENNKKIIKLQKENKLLKKTIQKLLTNNSKVSQSNKTTIDSKIYSNINNFIDN